MNMLRHHYIAGDDETIPLANLFKDPEKDISTMSEP
jgi:hypothetical protein